MNEPATGEPTAGRNVFRFEIRQLFKDLLLDDTPFSAHLASIESFVSSNDVLLDCKRRFKNLPERLFKSVEALVQEHFNRKRGDSISSATGFPPADRRHFV